ncbi:acriflavin resistance protein [Thermanaerovibrio acidaminovorans DSM 6589]|uniref:Acriflavin resistance protein n=1 Tax=Thermanaerovibrio acidaminovorans (strain ATCC 49978 / DSM 6589 / Su883) TaxID=525903 RepID=D1B6H3_THEAS|nr:efflux RND transporter permease subunit [Thermanaerovibrio acidaminovorans]ACZ19614.1 acriflavin resistance protein [Thermanaerovibrio acidaminovorans DSM 6589]
MKLWEFSVRRPVTVTMLTGAMVLFGLMALSAMGLQLIPDIDLPVVTVSTSMTGASAKVMDNDVADVIEDKLSTLSGVESMSSSSYQGVSITVLEFQLGVDVDRAAADVRDKVNLAARSLPSEADTPVVQKFSIGDRAIITLALVGGSDPKGLATFADKVLKPRIQAIEGVGEVGTPGLRTREIRVWLDPVKLEARNLMVKDVIDAFKAKHVELPAGSVKNSRQEIQLRLIGEYQTVEDLSSMPIKVEGNAMVRLRDVARVEDGLEDKGSAALYNGSDTIFITVKKQRGANEVAVCRRVREAVQEMRRQAPAGVNIMVIGDQSDYIMRSIRGVFSNVFQAVLLCALVMFLFFKTLRSTFITVISIPVSLIGSFLVMRALGLSINNLTMMGISLAVGMVVDATTVVLENVHRQVEGGLKPLEASIKGTQEVAFSVVAGAATTMAVFAPIAFMGGIVGRFFYHFGITVVVTVGLSLLVSLTLTPFLCSLALKHEPEPGRLGRAFDRFFARLEAGYRRSLFWAVGHRKAVVLAAFGLFVLGLGLAANIGKGFFPTSDRGSFSVDVELPPGSSLERTQEFIAKLDHRIRRNQYVKYTYGDAGSGIGGEANKGSISVELVPIKERPPIDQVIDQVRKDLSSFREGKLTFSQEGRSGVTMMLVGATTERLYQIAEQMRRDLEATGKVSDFDTDVRLNIPQLEILINRPMADALDLSVKDLAQEIQAYFGGTKVGVFKEGGFRYDIRIMADQMARTSAEDVKDVAVRANGSSIRIPGVVDVRKVLAPNVINRYSRRNSVEISVNGRGISTGELMTMMEGSFRKFVRPGEGVQIMPSGRSKSQRDDFKRLFTALAIAIALVYVVMAIQFESFLHPLTVMFSLPLLTPGAFGLLFLMGNELDMMSFIGIILLVGIVVNNGIILVDFINQEREKGAPKTAAVLTAGPLRLRPILITAVSTMVGAIPTALKLSEGADFRQSMAVAVVGGLSTSTLLTLFVVPTVYLILDDMKDRARALLRYLRGAKAPRLREGS